ncbi:MAG: SUMF1/EgtB/PvdO family nonheme iron enzyme, partial [Rhodoglobus sp.]|nr:SUMF1/EgtB/PvdO family nonheme iron enzyme [Rhodoglobus sp.]
DLLEIASSSNTLIWEPPAERHYYWRPKASVGGTWGNWSAQSGDFSTAPSWTPSPADGSTVDDTTPLLDWPDVSDASGYELQFQTTSGAIDGSQAITTTSSQRQVSPALSGGTYYWRVRALGAKADGTADWTAWSSIRSFTIVPPHLVTMVEIPAGTFQMGAAYSSTLQNTNEQPIHTVNLSAFRMSRNEITQSLYLTVTGTNPSANTDGADAASRPVEQVSWFDAVEFCNKLSEVEGLQPVYTITGRTPSEGYPITAATVSIDALKTGYRLPTESQWEYAARGGRTETTPIYHWGSDEAAATQYAWLDSNSASMTHAVGQKLQNGYDLYDMSGNVWEWCWDWSGSYTSAAQTDYYGPSSSLTGTRIRRGGGWGSPVANLRVSLRESSTPRFSSGYIGFRVVGPPSP